MIFMLHLPVALTFWVDGFSFQTVANQAHGQGVNSVRFQTVAA